MLHVAVIRSGIGRFGKPLSASVVSKASVEQHYRTPLAYPLETRNDWKTFEDAKEIAALLGDEFVATDAGKNVSPRYDITQIPKVGDKVSQAFNGDHYPAGQIKSISKSLKLIVTDTGLKFYRVRETGSWRNAGTWFLEAGHHSELNPSF